ncbi:uncharacterized protein LOC115370702 [Myripristis murdjan]|uniref:Glycosyltransferase family 92 protein n=1 Tax=Myripristis murdjan TaxID=586833 RepID=A0A667XLP8_9TELE|nr:uncharacterized protein LOC115370702 [Myripristis murdjan]
MVAVIRTHLKACVNMKFHQYRVLGFIEVIPWSMADYLNVSRGFEPQRDPGDLHYYGQIPALNDCVYRYMYRSKYVALHDMDELILPQTVDSWRELLPLLELNYGVDFCYKFENYVFPNTFKLPPPTPQPRHHLPEKCCPSWQSVSGVNILEHLYHEPDNFMRYSNHKIIVNPRVVFAPTVHGVLKSEKGCTWVHKSFARMYHTRPPALRDLTADQLVYDDRLLGYSARLILAVNAVLQKAGLIQEESTQ